jgi:hypothetical protein
VGIQIQPGFGHNADTKPYTAWGFRFTENGPHVYPISMACPEHGKASIHAGDGTPGHGLSNLQLEPCGLLRQS